MNLAALAATCGGSFDEALCLSSRVSERRELAEPDCYPEYDAWIACLAALTECSSGSGVPCPTEYSALGLCAR